jgi:RNA polymerase sigma-70 factor (ECF subfamily)
MSVDEERVAAWLRGAERTEPPVGLADALAQACGTARSARPELVADESELAEAIGRSLVDKDEPIAAIAGLQLGDLWLACACAGGDRAALLELDRPTLARTGADATTIDELIQQHRARLLTAEPERPPRIRGYRGHGDLRSWLKVALVRDAVRAQRRELTASSSDDEIDVLVDPAADPELHAMQDAYRAGFRRAFAHALAELPPRERNVLRYHLIDGLAIDDIGAIYRVHRATAARWLVRIRERLHEDTRAELMRSLAIGPRELDSVMRLIRSRLEASIAQGLVEPPTG